MRVLRSIVSCFLCLLLVVSESPRLVMAATPLDLPEPGTMVKISTPYKPAMLAGLTIDPHTPLNFKFLIENSDDNLGAAAFENESIKLIKYFMAALTLEEEQMWVNLSPYESDRIIPSNFSHTEMGRDLLAQDYLLKQLTASLMYPEDELGDTFWKRVKQQALARFGTEHIPMNTFNKIWIVPEQAKVYEHATGAVIVDSHLKVMLEEDYLALAEHAALNTRNANQETDLETGVSLQIVREVLIPEIEKEVNHGRTFANLRQIYSAVILATWYKNTLKESLLGSVYADRNKTCGISLDDTSVNQQIYDQYVQAFKKGVYDYIKEDYDAVAKKMIPRRYFSGGVVLETSIQTQKTSRAVVEAIVRQKQDNAMLVETKFDVVGASPIELRPMKPQTFKNNIYSKLIILEGRVNDEEPEVRTITAKAMAQNYYELLKAGLLSLTEVERRAQGAHYRLRTAMVTMLGDIYVDKVQAGEDVDVTWLEDPNVIVTDVRMANAQVLGRVYVERLKKDQSVDPTRISKLAKTSDSHSLKSTVGKALAAVYWQQYLQQDLRLDELKGFISSRDVTLSQALIDELKAHHITQESLGLPTDMGYLEDILENGEYYFKSVVAAVMVEVYALRVISGRMSVTALEDLLDAPNQSMRRAVPAALATVYVQKTSQGERVNLTRLTNRLRNPDKDIRRQSARALAQVYAAREEVGQDYNLDTLTQMIDKEEKFFAQSVAPLYIDIVVQRMQTRDRQAGDTELRTILQEHPNVHMRAAAYEALVSEYTQRLEAGETVDTDLLENHQEVDASFSPFEMIEGLANLLAKKVAIGQLTEREVEDRLLDADERIRSAAILALGKIYTAQLEEGVEVSVEPLLGMLTPENGPNHRYLIDTLSSLYQMKVRQGQAINLTYLEMRLESTNSFVRREATRALGDIYAGMIRHGRNIRGSKQAYRFWFNNQMYLNGATVNRRILNHLLQLTPEELSVTQSWLDQTHSNLSQFYGHLHLNESLIRQRIVPTIFIFELLVPDSSLFILNTLEEEGPDAIDKFQYMLVDNRATDVLLQFREEFPEVHISDVFKFIDILAAFSYFNKFDRINEIMESTFSWPDHLFRLLGAEISQMLLDELNQYTDDQRMQLMNQILEAVPESVKPYILLGGLRNSDRFTRRQAALVAGSLTTSKDELKRALFEAVDDVDGLVGENALDSLSRIGGHRTIIRLHTILDRIREDYVIRHIYDDHGSMVAYREKVDMTGTTADGFVYKGATFEVNPKAAQIERVISIIEERSNQRRVDKRIDLNQVKDQRLKRFFDFLKSHGLEKYVVVLGGGVRDAYTGEFLNDLDINIIIPMTEEDHREVLPTTAQVNVEMYRYVLDKLDMLAQALGAEVEDFLPPMREGAVMWEGLEVQYTGPIVRLWSTEDPNEDDRTVYLKRSVVGNNGWLYSSNTGAALLQMAIDYKGRLYGHVESLEDFDRGFVRLTGGRDNLKIGDVLRILRLRHQFGLIISDYDYQIIRASIESYIDGTQPLPESVMRNVVLKQLLKIEETAGDTDLAMRELGELGLLKLLKDKLGIDRALLAEQDFTKGGIDLNPNQIDLFVEKENGVGLMPVSINPRLNRDYQSAIGFVPTIIHISPAVVK